MNVLKYMPIPGPPTAASSIPRTVGQQDNQLVLKGDHRLTQNDQLSVRYFFDNFHNNPTYTEGNLLSYSNPTLAAGTRMQNIVGGWTKTFSSALLNEARIGYNHTFSRRFPPDGVPSMQDLGVRLPIYPTLASISEINANNFFNIGDNLEASFYRPGIEINDRITWNKGKHNLQFGGELQRYTVEIRNQFRRAGHFMFAGSPTTGTGNTLADFLLGQLSQFDQGTGEYKDYRGQLRVAVRAGRLPHQQQQAAGMPYVNHRWLGGLLTNFQTISQRIRRLHDLERYETEGQLALLPTRERLSAQADLEKLRANLGGVKYMQRPPDAMFVVDLKTEAIAVREAQRLRIPIIGLVDTNCDPDGIDYVVPGNDDAIKSCAVVAHAIGEAVREGRAAFPAEEERRVFEEEERQRREAEERARREAEEQARRQAQEAAAARPPRPRARAIAPSRRPRWRRHARARSAAARAGRDAGGADRAGPGRRRPPRAAGHRPDARPGLAAGHGGRRRNGDADGRRAGPDRARRAGARGAPPTPQTEPSAEPENATQGQRMTAPRSPPRTSPPCAAAPARA